MGQPATRGDGRWTLDPFPCARNRQNLLRTTSIDAKAVFVEGRTPIQVEHLHSRPDSNFRAISCCHTIYNIPQSRFLLMPENVHNVAVTNRSPNKKQPKSIQYSLLTHARADKQQRQSSLLPIIRHLRAAKPQMSPSSRSIQDAHVCPITQARIRPHTRPDIPTRRRQDSCIFCASCHGHLCWAGLTERYWRSASEYL